MNIYNRMHDQFQLTFILIDNNANLEITEFLTCQDAFACLLELIIFEARQIESQK